ncbi:MAG: hypothetical protein WC853_14845 [Thermodesulfovibrionales bacterium]
MNLEISEEDSEKFAAGMRKHPIKLADLLRIFVGKEPKKSEWREGSEKFKPSQNLPQEIEY